MNHYSSVYAVAAEHSSLHAFSSTKFYLFSHELDFLVNKEVLLRADYYAVGTSREGDDKKNLVDLRALGRLVHVGYFDVIWKDRAEPLISGLSYYRGEEVSAIDRQDFMARLSNAVHKLYDSRHRPEDRDMVKTIAFAEVDRVSPVLSDPVAYYFRKTLIPMELSFSDAGVSFPKAGADGSPKKIPASGMYRITQSLAYEFSTNTLLVFGQQERKVSFFGEGGERRLALFRLLAEAGGSLTKASLIASLGIEESAGSTKEKKFGHLVQGIRERLEAYVGAEQAKECIKIDKGEVFLVKFQAS